MKLKHTFIFLFFWSISFNAQNIYTYAGIGTCTANSGDGGPATSAQVYLPIGIASAFNNLYFTTGYYSTLRLVNNAGIISTLAGGGSSLGDGGTATLAQFYNPRGIELDPMGNIYIADGQNHRIRKINTSGIVNTIAGNGVPGFSGDGGLATTANIREPWDVALDAIGNVYFADAGNHRIRKIDTGGIITTVAGIGTAGFSGDGGLASLAQLYSPQAIELDATGNIYVVEFGNNCVRKINSSGVITTIAGIGGLYGNTGDGGLATLAKLGNPRGLALDASGNIYVADYAFGTIRKINTAGIISTIVGTGVPGYSGDNGPAINAQISPQHIALDADGNILIADGSNHRIRIVCINSCAIGVEEYGDANDEIKIFPNPANNLLKMDFGILDVKSSQIEIINSLGVRVLRTNSTNQIDVSSISEGIYNLRLFTTEGVITKKIVIQH
ncbi:MAG: T9SS type A sorting domain-containing protein [Bacteroidia bacterium]|nr:T9SS type A sorting domain-containing protein [Bacteroidia bacterium]